VNRNMTGWLLSGLGLAVLGLGKMIGGRIGAGIYGFGLAHVVLGFLERLRPSMR